MQDSRKQCGSETRIDEWQPRSVSQHQRLTHEPQIGYVASNKIVAGRAHRFGDVSGACPDIQYSSAFRQPGPESRKDVLRARTADDVHDSRNQAIALSERDYFTIGQVDSSSPLTGTGRLTAWSGYCPGGQDEHPSGAAAEDPASPRSRGSERQEFLAGAEINDPFQNLL